MSLPIYGINAIEYALLQSQEENNKLWSLLKDFPNPNKVDPHIKAEIEDWYCRRLLPLLDEHREKTKWKDEL